MYLKENKYSGILHWWLIFDMMNDGYSTYEEIEERTSIYIQNIIYDSDINLNDKGGKDVK